jgi:hypothetical protein
MPLSWLSSLPLDLGGAEGGWVAGWCGTGEVGVQELKRLREIPGLGGSDSAHVRRSSRALSARWVGSRVLLLLGGIV